METDSPISELQKLLDTLENLYSRIVVSAVHLRITSYHAVSCTPYDNDVHVSLLSYIDSVKYHVTIDPIPLNGTTVTNPAIPQTRQFDLSMAVSDPISNVEYDTQLSNYFKKNNVYTELSPPLCDKLKASAWEHTHSAIRLAHLGDFANAKLHADLANNSIHELGHYMSEADFNDFRNAIKTGLLNNS